ncbi:11509_t:CDS:1, partial [Dentiscutata heterogama]
IMNNKEFINECNCLNNGDFVMVTSLGVSIWTFNTQINKIELNYCWNDGNVWDWNKENVIKLFDDEKGFKKKYFFPPSSYIGIIRYNSAFSQPPQLYNKESNSDKDRFFFNELIEKHINNKFFLILYGKKLIEDIIIDDDDELLRKLFKACTKQIVKDNEIINTQIFKIFSQSITEIFRKNQSFFEEFITQISLFCVLHVEKKNQVLKHLSHYQCYSSLSELTYLDSLVDTFYNSFLYKKIIPYLYTKIANLHLYKKIVFMFPPPKFHPQLFLMFPLPNFVTYYENDEKDEFFLKKLFKPKSCHFINIDDLTFYSTWN